MTPNRSVRVPVMSVAQFRELARVRVAIEGHAAAEAARLRTDDDLVQIGAVEAAFRAPEHAAASRMRGFR